MKVKVINRSEEEYTRERSQDLRKVHKNLDPTLHPFEKAVEYTRALNAAKLDRVFAKPFLAALTHDDGITCLSRNPRRLNSLVAGSADGELRYATAILVLAATTQYCCIDVLVHTALCFVLQSLGYCSTATPAQALWTHSRS